MSQLQGGWIDREPDAHAVHNSGGLPLHGPSAFDYELPQAPVKSSRPSLALVRWPVRFRDSFKLSGNFKQEVHNYQIRHLDFHPPGNDEWVDGCAMGGSANATSGAAARTFYESGPTAGALAVKGECVSLVLVGVQFVEGADIIETFHTAAADLGLVSREAYAAKQTQTEARHQQDVEKAKQTNLWCLRLREQCESRE